MTKWEYKMIVAWGRDEHIEYMNELGNEGWELVWVRKESEYVFKRPLSEPSQSPVVALVHR